MSLLCIVYNKNDFCFYILLYLDMYGDGTIARLRGWVVEMAQCTTVVVAAQCFFVPSPKRKL